MNKREIERKARIDKILIALKEGKEVDVFKVMFEFGSTRRTSQEYIDAAKSQVDGNNKG